MTSRLPYFLMLLFALFCISPAQTHKAYAGSTSRIDVVDVDSMKVITTIPGANAYRMVITPDGKKLYATNHNREVHVIDTEADTILVTFNPSKNGVYTSELEGIAISPDGKRVYVSDESSDGFFVIDTETDTVIAAVSLDMDEAEDMVVSADGKWLYLNDNSDVVKIDTDSLIIRGRVYVGNDGHGLTLSSSGKTIYAEGRTDTLGGVVVIRADSMIVTNSLDAAGYHMQTSRNGRLIFGVNEGNRFTVIDTLTESVTVDSNYSSYGIRGIAETADQKYILLAGSRGLDKVDASSYSIAAHLDGGYRTVVIKPVVSTGMADETDAVAPLDFVLEQNFPNPFNPETVIRYYLTESTQVRLTIYDLNGRVVRVLVDRWQRMGSHTLRFNASGLASGIYFYELKSPDYISRKRMLLLK